MGSAEQNVSNSPLYREHEMKCGCRWRFALPIGWFLVELGPDCPATTNWGKS